MPDQNDIIYDQYTIDWEALVKTGLDFFGGVNVSPATVVDILGTVLMIGVGLAALVTVLCFVGYVYASIRINQLVEDSLERIQKQEKLWQELAGSVVTSRFDDIKAHVASDNPNDWKLAIIEADIEMGRVLTSAGYAGATLGEQLKLARVETFTTLEDAWEAHKVRNRVAHDGADFVLTKKMARDTIQRYQRVFQEFDHSPL